MNLYRLRACLKCCGDLAHDDGDWICLQCGTYYYTGLYPETLSDTPGGGLLVFRQAMDELRQAQDEFGQAQDGAGTPDGEDADGQLAPAAD
jgi:predicted  nucleic acid-binding Zn-ribbon protein